MSGEKTPINGSGLTRLFRAFNCSVAGFGSALKNESAFRQETLLCLFLSPLALWLGENGIERALLLGTLMLVLMAELFNSAVEAVVDRIGPETHVLSGRAKDMGSAAVLISLINVVVVWFLVIF
ncbi:MAG: diacylglycerol kinase [Desulfobulbaceae bacterium]|nr:diacylglycerol kinase [Desulfobulbaceae bacterium]